MGPSHQSPKPKSGLTPNLNHIKVYYSTNSHFLTPPTLGVLAMPRSKQRPETGPEDVPGELWPSAWVPN